MGIEVWIAILIAGCGLSGWIGYAYAARSAPKQSELDALAAELDEARRESASVQSNVNEHFEQSALLFGKLAADYREFLDHFSSSAQALGLSESRARELIEQGFQPLLTHGTDQVVAEEAADSAAADSAAADKEIDAADSAAADKETDAADKESAAADRTTDTVNEEPEPINPSVPSAGIGDVTVEMPDELAASKVPAGTSYGLDESEDDEAPASEAAPRTATAAGAVKADLDADESEAESAARPSPPEVDRQRSA